MKRRTPWSREELLVAFRLYCRTPFGKLHQHNPDIIETARLLGRTPSAVGMKACNFASLDPVQQARNIAALGNVSRADRALWDDFTADAEAVAAEAEQTWDRLTDVGERGGVSPPPFPNLKKGDEELIPLPIGPTESEQLVRVRRVQRFFRAAVLSSYGYRCALSGIPLPDLLNASHIIPWSDSIPRRADPRNGIALHALYDRAFDRGYLSFDENLCVILSPALRIDDPSPLHASTLLALEGQPLTLPERFPPDLEAVGWHREVVFRGE